MHAPDPAIPEARPHLDLPAVLLAFQIHFSLSLNEFKAAFDVYNPKQTNSQAK